MPCVLHCRFVTKTLPFRAALLQANQRRHIAEDSQHVEALQIAISRYEQELDLAKQQCAVLASRFVEERRQLKAEVST